MARTNIPLSVAVADAVLADPAGTAVDPTNGHNIALVSTAVPPARAGSRGILFRVNNTHTSPHNFILRKGANPPAFRADLGDLTISITNATTQWIWVPDSSKYVQSDGSLNVDLGAGITGTITAFSVPRTITDSN